jgi:hypothetical protein
MRNVHKMPALLSLVSLSSAAYAVEPTPPPEDIRCVIVAMQISISDDPAQRTGGNMLAMYYVGRLNQYPAKALEDAIFKQLPGITPDSFKSEADRCGRILMEKGQVLTQIGNSITRRAKELQQKQSAPTTPATASPAPTTPAAASPAAASPASPPPQTKPAGK